MTAELMARNPVTNPTPAEVFRKAREHNITVAEARRVIIAANKVKAAFRTEYGAKVIQTGTIYMHDFNLDVVEKFITEMSAATPLSLVTREWVGDTHGAWKEAK